MSKLGGLSNARLLDIKGGGRSKRRQRQGQGQGRRQRGQARRQDPAGGQAGDRGGSKKRVKPEEREREEVGGQGEVRAREGQEAVTDGTMLLGRVVGRLWAARQAASLAGRKLLLVRPETAAGEQSRAADRRRRRPGRRPAIACWSPTAAGFATSPSAPMSPTRTSSSASSTTARWSAPMILGRVIGQVWATRRDPRLAAGEAADHPPARRLRAGVRQRHLVAVDDVDAGVGRRRDRLPGRAGARLGGRRRHAGRRGGAGRRRSGRAGAGRDGRAGRGARDPRGALERCSARRSADDPGHRGRAGLGDAQGARAGGADAAAGGGARRRRGGRRDG